MGNELRQKFADRLDQYASDRAEEACALYERLHLSDEYPEFHSIIFDELIIFAMEASAKRDFNSDSYGSASMPDCKLCVNLFSFKSGKG